MNRFIGFIIMATMMLLPSALIAVDINTVNSYKVPGHNTRHWDVYYTLSEDEYSITCTMRYYATFRDSVFGFHYDPKPDVRHQYTICYVDISYNGQIYSMSFNNSGTHDLEGLYDYSNDRYSGQHAEEYILSVINTFMTGTTGPPGPYISPTLLQELQEEVNIILDMKGFATLVESGLPLDPETILALALAYLATEIGNEFLDLINEVSAFGDINDYIRDHFKTIENLRDISNMVLIVFQETDTKLVNQRAATLSIITNLLLN